MRFSPEVPELSSSEDDSEGHATICNSERRGISRILGCFGSAYSLPNATSSCDATGARQLATLTGNVSAKTLNEDNDLTWGFQQQFNAGRIYLSYKP